MKRQVFPKEFIKASLEHYTFRISRKSSRIYLVLLLTIGGFVTSLPFVFLDVGVNATGLINTSEIRHSLASPVSGKITYSQITESQYVRKGDTLLAFDKSNITFEKAKINRRLAQLRGYLDDLTSLVANPIYSSVLTDDYQLAQKQFLGNHKKLTDTRNAKKTTHSRQSKLYEAKVIASAEFEPFDTDLRNAETAIEIFHAEAINKWKRESLNLENEVRDLDFRISQLAQLEQQYFLIAPVTGEIQNTIGLVPGQHVSTGLTLGEISPETNLIATCWFPPEDIGLISPDQKGTLRIAAFNANQWGFVRARVKDISSDAYILDGQPFFKVDCELEKNYLELKNGFKGKLKKGMTLQASFIVSRRSLFQLLHDKVDDWLNPHKQ